MHSFSFERKYLHVGSCGDETPGYDGNCRTVGTLDLRES